LVYVLPPKPYIRADHTILTPLVMGQIIWPLTNPGFEPRILFLVTSLAKIIPWSDEHLTDFFFIKKVSWHFIKNVSFMKFHEVMKCYYIRSNALTTDLRKRTLHKECEVSVDWITVRSLAIDLTVCHCTRICLHYFLRVCLLVCLM
jgi:hypothetical protein